MKKKEKNIPNIANLNVNKHWEFVVAVCKKPTNSGELQIDQLATSIRRMTLIVLL